MKPETWIVIVSFIGLGLIIAAAIYWKRSLTRGRLEDRSGGFLTLAERDRFNERFPKPRPGDKK